jgi:hypothetical protein
VSARPAERTTTSPEAKKQDPLRRLTRYDWIFLFLAWLTGWYLVLITNEAFAANSNLGFDFLPVVAGVPVVILGWRAVRLREQVDEAVAALDEGAGLVITEENSFATFMLDLKKTIRWWGLALALIVDIVMVAGLAYVVVAGFVDVDQGPVMLVLTVLLVAVMVGVGFLIGQLLGHLIGFGQLNSVMLRHGISIAGLSTVGARSAMRSLEGVFRFSVLTSMVMCGWFVVWWVTWHVGLDPHKYRKAYSGLFLAFWAVSFGVFLFAGRRPALGFQRMIDELYGGADRRRSIDRQLKAATQERATLAKSGVRTPQQRDIAELDRYIDDLKDRQFHSRLLHPYVLNGLAVFNVIFLVAPWLWAR